MEMDQNSVRPTDRASSFNIGRPGPVTGRGFNGNKREHLDHLLVFVRPIAETRQGMNGDYDVAACDYVLCVDCRDVWISHAVSGKALVPQLLNGISTTIPGRLTTGEAK